MQGVNGAARPLGVRLCAAAALALAAGLAAAPAHSADVSGSAAIFTNRSCAPDAVTCTSTISRLQPNQFFGGYGSTFSASSTLLNGASASAAVSFGSDYLPTIQLGSQAGAETRTGSSATSFRSFTYTGDVAIDLAIQGQLHFLTSGDQVGPFPANELPGDGQLNVVLALMSVATVAAAYQPTTDVIDIISNSAINFPDCGGEGVLAVSSFSSGTSGLAAGEYNQTIGLSEACGGGAILVNPGDSFVLIATMQAISNRGGFIDATHTFSVRYDEENTVLAGTTQSVGEGFLTASIANGASVPEPATWALMIGGFGLAGGALRRRRRALA